MILRLLAFSALLVSACDAYKILVYSPKIGHSHVKFLGFIADTLVEAGNDVTVLLPEVHPIIVDTNGTRLAKIVPVEVDERIREIFDVEDAIKNYWTLDAQNPLSQLSMFKDYLKSAEMLCEDFLKKTDVLQWIKDEKFDVVISEAFDVCFIGSYKALGIRAHIVASATFLFETVSYAAGVPFPPSTIPSSISGLLDQMSFTERAKNLMGVGVIHMWMGGMMAVHQSVIDRKFGKGYSNVLEEISDCSLIITNSDPLLDFPRPTLDKVINIGGVSIPVPKPLDKSWEDKMALREMNVLVSFGSIAKAHLMPMEMKKSILRVFLQFPNVTFFWKYETSEDEIAMSLPPNVIISKWVPQNDLLNHKKMSLFITHAGMNSILEAANRGVPLLCIPVFGDQMRNAKTVVKAGIGEEMNKLELLDSGAMAKKVRRMLEENKYQKAAVRLAEMMANRPISQKEHLVRSVEFVARFGRLPNMKPASVKLTFAEYYLLDIIAVFVVSVLVVVVVSFIILRVTFRVLRFVVHAVLSSAPELKQGAVRERSGRAVSNSKPKAE
ncbi:hypothetical protein L596_004508 [Steinernema carpocapsae]|uniref:glucuronosyltransferase n=1 Tax=Steinernema carpocapsae TaxID=34508 RepID=A0A4U8UW09_STECR|nr:hypothetical protein L596_004508 [Steinernema carpocapsae]